jgi:hypothetical protein
MKKTMCCPDTQKCLYWSQFKQQSSTESSKAVTCSHDILSYNKAYETKNQVRGHRCAKLCSEAPARFVAVLRIRIRMFLGLLDADPLVRIRILV